jgi:competence protein ComEC
MAALKLARAWSGAAGSSRGIRSSAQGKVTVIFPAGRLEDLKGFGRSSTVYLEGGFMDGRSGESGPGMFRATAVHVISPAPPLEQFRTGLRRNLVSRLSRPENRVWGSLSLALLLGVRDNLDSSFARSYRDAGISHVLALSGMHLAVLSALIAFLFKRSLGLKGAAGIGAVFVIGYVFLIGSQPSLDRSAIMYLLGALALTASLARNPASLLNLAFLIQIVWQPESGLSVSFMLSYLALWGILHLGQEINGLFRGRIPPALLQGLSASLGAFAATAPVCAAGFGILQPGGILSGLVIVPLTSLFMVASIGYLALDLCLPLLARPLGLGLSLLYEALDKLVGFSARAPGLVLGSPPGYGVLLPPESWLPVLALSLLFSLLVFFLARRRVLADARLSPFL